MAKKQKKSTKVTKSPERKFGAFNPATYPTKEETKKVTAKAMLGEDLFREKLNRIQQLEAKFELMAENESKDSIKNGLSPEENEVVKNVNKIANALEAIFIDKNNEISRLEAENLQLRTRLENQKKAIQLLCETKK